MTTKATARMTALEDVAAAASQVNAGAGGVIIADATRALKRIVARADVPAGMEPIEIMQLRGPTIGFVGRLIAETSFETRDGSRMTLEVYETKAGGWIAVTAAEAGDIVDARAIVVPPGDDIQAMQFAVMGFFAWENRARPMVRQQLEWTLTMHVD